MALRDLLAKLPEQAIPEFALLNEDDWYAAVEGPLIDTEDYRLALSKLRGRAERRFALTTQPALKAYVAAHGAFPKTLSDFDHTWILPCKTLCLPAIASLLRAISAIFAWAAI